MSLFFRRLGAVCGYLLFSLLLLAVLLALRFPAQPLRVLLEAHLSPQLPALTCTIGPGQLTRQGLLFNFISWTRPGESSPLLRIERLQIRPLLRGRDGSTLPLAEWNGTVYGGSLRGTLGLVPGRREFRLTAWIEGLRLEENAALRQALDRNLSGRLQAEVRLAAGWKPLRVLELTLGLALDDAVLSLRQPLLGLDQLELTGLNSRWRLQGGQWLAEECNFGCNLGTGKCDGMVIPLPPPSWGRLELHGRMTPASGLPAQNRDLPFSLAGTMELPSWRWN
ncbi:MAG: hypothetical protein BWK76_10790 [Desulfobulbaceae bacterium A2]|nr:MAG: hypothetical protein BWK76_10790 [Desulfobulbaceae bacterium A2]